MLLTPPGNARRIAVAVSGGADSMALAHMLAIAHPDVHVLTVDHGLRPESALEAAQIGAWFKSFSNVTHKTLRWEGDKPQTGRMEAARDARYALMAAYCRESGIKYLALGHHRDDQAETFLMRLTHGSGIDGLASMRMMQAYDDAVYLWRPLLTSASHDDLKNYCRHAGIQWIEDPTNADRKYKRNRLRAVRDVLDAEGLSAKRLATTAQRLERASDALRILSVRLAERAVLQQDAQHWAFDLKMLGAEPAELVVRVLRMAITALGNDPDHGARFEKVEALAERILQARENVSATLGGCLLKVDARRAILTVTPEKSAKTLPLSANGL